MARPKRASFTKSDWESWIIGASFEDDLETNETIVLGTSTVTAVESDGTDATATVLNQAGKAVSGFYLQIRVQAGTDGELYTISFRAKTSLGNNYEKKVDMKIDNESV